MSEALLHENERTALKSTKPRKTTMPEGMGMFSVLKDMGLLGLIIYTIWADGTKNTNDINTLQAADISINQRLTIVETNYSHINSQLQRLEEQTGEILLEIKK